LFGALTEFLAKTIAHRTTALILVAVVIFGVALLIILNRHNLDSEVLDLLPGQFESVTGLKQYNNELTFPEFVGDRSLIDVMAYAGWVLDNQPRSSKDRKMSRGSRIAWMK